MTVSIYRARARGGSETGGEWKHCFAPSSCNRFSEHFPLILQVHFPSSVWGSGCHGEVLSGGESPYLPANISSFSVALGLILVQMSMVKRVLALLKMDVSELIRDASITDSIKPRRPGKDTAA